MAPKDHRLSEVTFPGAGDRIASSWKIGTAFPTNSVYTLTKGALAGLQDFAGRIVIDANNPIEAPLFKPFDLADRSSSEVFAGLVPGARVVKAFNHLRPDRVSGDPAGDGGRRVLFYAGDDGPAKAELAALIDRLGVFGIDLGSLAVGGRRVQCPGGPLTALNLAKFD